MTTPRSLAAARSALLAFALPLASSWLGGAPEAAAAVYYVDGSNPAASTSGPGTSSSPYSTISSAVSAHAGPGNTILVRAGVYPEQVTIPASGASGDTFVVQAVSPSAVVDGGGVRNSAFVVSGKSWIRIDGFTVTNTVKYGIQVASSASHVAITRNTVSRAGSYGIQISHSSSVLVANNTVSNCDDHGIFLTSTTASTVQDNESFANARPSQRAANGINIYSSSGILIQRNRLHDNQDTGLQFQSGGNNCICLQNRSWKNGDHGYDHLASSGNLHIGDVAWGNYKDGFSIEGTSPGQQLYDCIAVDNGLTTDEYDLWVDSSSSSGFASNDNIFWNSTSQVPIKFISTRYSTLGGYVAATGFDTRSIQADPLFVNPGAGDFHLRSGSPAIDSGNSGVANWPSQDAEGKSRVDDPATSNTGTGSIKYADRGALEFQVAASLPVAALTVTPSAGNATLRVTADASGSYETNGTIVSYRFDFGDGSVVGPQSSATATHSYSTGNWTAKVTVTDQNGKTASATAPVTVSGSPSASLSVTPSSGSAPLQVLADASGSHESNGTIVSYRFDFGDGTIVGPQPGAPASHTYLAGSWTARVTVTDAYGKTASASRSVSVSASTSSTPVAALAVTPSSGTAPLAVLADASGSTDTGGTIVSYKFDFGDGTVVGPQSGATANHTYAAGSWTAKVTVTDNNAKTSTASVAVTASSSGGGGTGTNLVGNPSFESSTSGWNGNGGATLSRVAGGHDGAYSCRVQAPSTGTSDFGLNDDPNWVSKTAATGTLYRYSAWVRSDASHGSAKIRIREYVSGSSQGSYYSPVVTLSTSWQLVSLDYVVKSGGSSLDFQVLDVPATSGEVFQVDDVSIVIVGPAAAAAAAAPAIADGLGAPPVFAVTPIAGPGGSATTLRLVTTRPGPLRADLFDPSGRRVWRLADEAFAPAGVRELAIEPTAGAEPLRSGVYFYRVEAAEGLKTGRVVLLR
jgi:parallel beta-helix repeat protein